MAKSEAQAAQPAAPAKSTAPKFTLEALRKHRLELFGVNACAFDGATCELDAAGEYTVEEIKNTIERWGKKEAK